MIFECNKEKLKFINETPETNAEVWASNRIKTEQQNLNSSDTKKRRKQIHKKKPFCTKIQCIKLNIEYLHVGHLHKKLYNSVLNESVVIKANP